MTFKLFMYSLARPSAGPGDRERCTESEASSEAQSVRWAAEGRGTVYLYSIKSARMTVQCVQLRLL
jgi:hypothetical protein